MKKIINILLCIFLIAGYSCTEIDNYDGPDSTLQGQLTDKVTGKNYITETGGVQLMLEELSWSDTPAPQYFGCKPDGSFFNSRLFSGHYRVTPEQGAFWPIQGVEADIANVTTLNFEIEPFLHVFIDDYTLTGTVLTVKCHITEAKPSYNIRDIRLFVNNTSFVGDGAKINSNGYQNAVINVNKLWTAVPNDIYTFTLDLQITGRTLYFRAGARVNSPAPKYNYSEIIKIDVP